MGKNEKQKTEVEIKSKDNFAFSKGRQVRIKKLIAVKDPKTGAIEITGESQKAGATCPPLKLSLDQEGYFALLEAMGMKKIS